MKLRNYQENLINNTRKSFINNNRLLCVAPCGSGKTIMFAYMCSEHIKKHPDGYVWFLVHRQELIDQTIKTFDNNAINRDKVLIGMVQSVSRHIDRYNKPSFIVFDEAHHATAKTWTNILDAYPNVPVVGLTATPCRMDGRPLGDIFNSLITSVDAEWLIQNHYLSPYDYYAPKVNIEDAQWQVKGSDYDQQDVGRILDERKIYGDVMKYIDLSKKIIIYCPTVKFSEQLVNNINTHFNSSVAKHFDGNTPDKERKQIIEDFRSGKVRILSNVDLIGEGFDVPDCDCCILLRPTLSVALYIQQSMRCMRYREGKKAVIYDLVGNVFKHGMPTDKREWSLDKSIKVRNKTDEKELIVRECKKCMRVYRGNSRYCPYCGNDNGKTKREIEIEKQIELEQIKEVERKKQRREVGLCSTEAQLIQLAVKRGYKNPAYWARSVMNGRKSKV